MNDKVMTLEGVLERLRGRFVSRNEVPAYDIRLQRSEFDAIEAAIRERDALRAKVDALMLEYCPDEMAAEQKAEWAKHQTPVEPAAGEQK